MRRLISSAVALAAMLAIGGAQPAFAQDAAAGDGKINLELNKLETDKTTCRGYFVVNNRTPDSLKELRIDVILFDKAQVILRRVALSFLDVRSGRTKVVLFDFPDLACDNVGKLLVNEIMGCNGAAGAISTCADALAVSTRASAGFEY